MDQVEEIKKRVEIAEFIGGYLQLKKAGINYSGLCPFHNEKTPSFMVSPERQSFRCFGCGESGDVISFLQKIEGLTFPEALKILADKVGVQLESRPRQEIEKEKSVKEKIFHINLIAAKYFKQILWSKKGEKVLQYLRGRGLSDKTIEKLKIGFAPETNELQQYYSRHGFSFNDLSLAGHPERFRYRIMFPIIDRMGQVIGFSGRIFEQDLPKTINLHPKYLNTPETKVFYKSKTLYGLNLAKDFIRKQKSAIVVEGQMDVAASIEAGVENVVASSGTALTEDHLKILSRYTPNIIFAFDEDEAGQKAANQAVQSALELSLEPKLVKIDKYKDVGELVQKQPSAWPKTLAKALPPVEWLSSAYDKANMSALEKKQLVAKALKFIARMQDEIEKAHYINFLAKTVSVPPIAVEKALAKLSVAPKTVEENKQTAQDLEAMFVSALIDHPDLAQGLSLSEITFQNDKWANIYNQVKNCYNSKKEITACLKDLLNTIDRDLAGQISAFALEWDQKIAEDKNGAKTELVAIYGHLQRRVRDKLKQEFAAQIAKAEQEGDLKKVKELMVQLQDNLRSN